MRKDLQPIDDLFLDAIDSHEADPSPAVWEGLQAQLDKEDAATYRKRFITTKRIAILLFLLLSFVIYENGLVRFNAQNSAGKNDLPKKGAKQTGRGIIKDSPVSGQNNSSRESSTLQQEQARVKKTNATQEGRGKPVEAGIVTPDGSNYSLLNKKYSSGRHPGSSAIDRANRRIRINENQSDMIFPKTMLTGIQPFNFSVSTGQLIRESGNPAPYTKLRFSDSLRQAMVYHIRPKKSRDNSFKPYWALTAMASPELAQYRLEDDLPDMWGNQQDEKKQIEQRENHEFSFKTGLMLTRQLKKHWGLQSGVLYSNTSIDIQPQTIYASKDAGGAIAFKYNSSSGYAFIRPDFSSLYSAYSANASVNGISEGDSISTTSARHHFQYLSIPILLKYSFETKKFSFSPALGFSGSFLTGERFETAIDDSLSAQAVRIKKLEGSKPFFLGLIAFADTQYRINNIWALNVMPGFNYAITSITKNNTVKTYPYSFHIGVGATVKF